MPDPAVPEAKTGAPAGQAGATGTPLTPTVTPEAENITLDGRPVQAKKGEMLIAAAERAGTYIPRFCYHPRMKPVGMCRMCLVDVKGPRGYTLSPACYIPVSEGMEVVTDSAKVKKAQDGVLEFLLVNHPLDCPVCDKGGECPLQDQTLAYGPGETRFVEEKRHWEKPVPLSSLILIDRERCIQCARCTRFAEEVAGDAGIDFASRSDSTEVAIYPGEPFVSNFSGNVVQICPVGALLAKPYRFRARPWDLEQVETTCTLCAVGCRVAAQSSSEQVVRFLGIDSDPVNWGWLCDKGRFGYEALNSPERLTSPMARRPVAGSDPAAGLTELVEVTWAEAFAEIRSRLRGVPGENVGVIGGARLPNEDAYAWAKFARTVLGTDNVDAQLGDGLPAEVVASLPRASIDDICSSSLIVTLAPDIKEELPVLYLRLRHALVEKGVPLIELAPMSTGLSSRASQSLRYRPGELGSLVHALTSGSAVSEDIAGVPAGEIERARLAIAAAAGSASAVGGGPVGGAVGGGAPSIGIVLGRPSVAETPHGAVEASLALAAIPGTAFLPALRRSNVNGAIDLGLAPGLLPGRVSLRQGREWFEQAWGAELPSVPGLGSVGMLTRAASGRMDVLFLVGADPLSDCPDKGLAKLGLQSTGFVVAIDAFLNASSEQADVVLPAAVYTERRGSFTNIEGRVTWLGQKVTPPGTARPDWMIVADLAQRMGKDLGFSSIEELWDEIERVSPLHAGASQALLVSRQGRNGVVLPLGSGPASSNGAQDRVAPIDPMADPGIASVELHPAPPVSLSVAGAGVRRADLAEVPLHDQQALHGQDSVPAEQDRMRAPQMLTLDSLPVPLHRPAPPSTRPASAAATSEILRLVAWRPMWDGGVLVQKSPSLAKLHPSLRLAVNPSDLARLSGADRARVRVSTQRGSTVLEAVADPGVAPGCAAIPFNLPEGGAGALVDASADYTEVVVEPLGSPSSGGAGAAGEERP
jgi:NADH-quinone oxidoreductase subunit G